MESCPICYVSNTLHIYIKIPYSCSYFIFGVKLKKITENCEKMFKGDFIEIFALMLIGCRATLSTMHRHSAVSRFFPPGFLINHFNTWALPFNIYSMGFIIYDGPFCQIYFLENIYRGEHPLNILKHNYLL